MGSIAMLAHRIIPTLLYAGTKLVKGSKFDPWRRVVGHAMQAAKVHAARGVDELIMLDVTATPEGRRPDAGMISTLTAGSFTPITVGGGIRSADDVKMLLQAGADKVAIKTSFFIDPHFIRRLADQYGSQAICVAIDYRDDAKVSAIEYCQLAEQMGAGEILLTSMDREGTTSGYDLQTIYAAAKAIGIPLIAHGGCSGYPDMHAAIQAGANAVAAGALFQWTDATPKGAAQYLADRGIEVRL